MSVQEIAPGVFVGCEATGANYGLVQTEAGSVLIDAPWIPKQARAWRAEVERLSPSGVAYQVYTDYHLDHILGSHFMPPALTIAHEAAWKHLKALDHDVMLQRALDQAQELAPDQVEQLAEACVVMPEVTVESILTLWCAEQRIEVIHFGGHTPATVGVYLPDKQILFTGDLVVNGLHPYMADANSRQWIASLERVRGMDVRLLVPGRGPIGAPEMIDRLYSYLVDFRARVEDCFHAGHTRRETVERVKPVEAFPFPSGDEDRLRRLLRSSVERVYDEIKKEAIRSRQQAS